MILNLPIFHSQHGEDYLAWKMLRRDKKHDHYYVEVGALDGRRFSNSYTFEQLGWNGICIEAHPEYYEHTVRNRPNATVVHAACSDSNEDHITFHANHRGTLSSVEPLDENMLKDRFGEYFGGYEPIKVPARTLTSILKEANAPRNISMLSIDVEGHEMQVLRGIDFNQYNFRLIFVEAMEEEEAAITEAFMMGRGYQYARQIGGNLIFCKRPEDVSKVNDIQISVPLLHTAHPLDGESTEKIVYPATYEKRNWLRMLRRIAGVY